MLCACLCVCYEKTDSTERTFRREREIKISMVEGRRVCVCVVCICVLREDRHGRRGCVVCMFMCVLREDRQHRTNISEGEGDKDFNGGGKEGVCVCCLHMCVTRGQAWKEGVCCVHVYVCVTRRQTAQNEHFEGRGR